VHEWQERFVELLDQYPHIEAGLRGWLDDGRPGAVNQTVLGFDHTQQAVLGHGKQTNRFGRQGSDG
jgi:hypothetical protein